jgi:hypothetical protein
MDAPHAASSPDLDALRPSEPAAPVRSIAGQSVEELGGPTGLLWRQRRDHAELDRLLDAAQAGSGAEQDEVLGRLARLVFPHAFAEEAVVWPALRASLPDGQALTERNEQEHQDVNELWRELERTPAGTPRRTELVDRLAALLRQDARDEEDVLLPRLASVLDAGQLRRLGRAWELVRRTAPTRPHPLVSRRPPGNVLAALPLSLLDRSRDGLDRGARALPALSPALTGASGALALAAHAVEHLPPLRRGERPSTRAARTDAS